MATATRPCRSIALAVAMAGCTGASGSATARPSIVLTGLGNGRVTVDELARPCGGECGDRSSDGASLRLTAIPDPTSTFLGWLGACSGTEPCVLPPDKRSERVTARFGDSSAAWSSLVASHPDSSRAWGLAVSSIGATVVAGADDALLTWFDARGERVRRLEAAGAIAHAVSLDAAGNAIVVGSALRAHSEAPELAWLARVGSSQCGFVAKLTPEGQLVWSHLIEASLQASLDAVAIDDDGASYVAGSFSGKLELGRDRFDSESAGLVVRFTSDGAVSWARERSGGFETRYRGPGLTSVAVAHDGSVIVGSAKLGSMPGVRVAALSSDGGHRWSWRSSVDGVEIRSLTALPDGGVVAGGSVQGALSFGGHDVPAISSVATDALLLRFGPGGEERWAQRFGGAGHDEVLRVSGDGAGGILASGGFTGRMQFGEELIESEAYAAVDGTGNTPPTDAFVVGLDANGQQRWADRYGHAASDLMWAAAVDAHGGLYLLLEHIDVRFVSDASGTPHFGEHAYVLTKRGEPGSWDRSASR